MLQDAAVSNNIVDACASGKRAKEGQAGSWDFLTCASSAMLLEQLER